MKTEDRDNPNRARLNMILKVPEDSHFILEGLELLRCGSGDI